MNKKVFFILALLMCLSMNTSASFISDDELPIPLTIIPPPDNNDGPHRSPDEIFLYQGGITTNTLP